MFQYEAGCMRVYYEQFAAMYGMTLDDFVSGMGVENFDGLVEMYREELTSSARSYLIYQAIAEDKGLTVTDEDVKAEFADMDESSYKDIVDYYGMPYIKCMMLNSKVAEMIRDSAVIE
jgi:trigger factor